MPERAVNPRSIPEIKEAISLFETWEANVKDSSAAGRFAAAVELLDDYLECEPDSPHKEFIQNLKLSNTRSLLQHLSQVAQRDLSIWLDYVIPVVSTLGKEADSVMASNLDLKKDFDSFLNVWGNDVLEALEVALSNKRQ